MTFRGFFAAVLALVALEAVVRTNESADRVGTLLETAGDLARRVMSPAVAAIPDRRTTGSGGLQGLDNSPGNPFTN